MAHSTGTPLDDGPKLPLEHVLPSAACPDPKAPRKTAPNGMRTQVTTESVRRVPSRLFTILNSPGRLTFPQGRGSIVVVRFDLTPRRAPGVERLRHAFVNRRLQNK